MLKQKKAKKTKNRSGKRRNKIILKPEKHRNKKTKKLQK